jgi:hypothetical protein
MRSSFSKAWLGIAIIALAASGFVQRHVEKRRTETNLTWAQSEKQALEVGFLALGGFRGLLADVLWVRAIRHQDSARFYELKLLCDMILKLQPTFTQVHAFQAYNMSYNLAYKSQGCEDKWYWIQSGLTTLEKGLERNYRNYALWFEMGYQYFDRLGDIKMAECVALRQRELPRIDDIPEDQRQRLFLGERAWAKGNARPDEHLRWASYFFFKAIETGTDPTPLRTERQFGQCIQKLGHWRSKKTLEELRQSMRAGTCKWDDWGAEEWWVDVREKNQARGDAKDPSVPQNLHFLMCDQMNAYFKRANDARRELDFITAAKNDQGARDAYARFKSYFPKEDKTMEVLIMQHRDTIERLKPRDIKNKPAETPK